MSSIIKIYTIAPRSQISYHNCLVTCKHMIDLNSFQTLSGWSHTYGVINHTNRATDLYFLCDGPIVNHLLSSLAYPFQKVEVFCACLSAYNDVINRV